MFVFYPLILICYTALRLLSGLPDALDYIRTAPDRDEAFAEAVNGIDMVLEQRRRLSQ